MTNRSIALGLGALDAAHAGERARREAWEAMLSRPDAIPLPDARERSLANRLGLHRMRRRLRLGGSSTEQAGSVG
jgi:hypothetical protein